MDENETFKLTWNNRFTKKNKKQKQKLKALVPFSTPLEKYDFLNLYS